MIPSATLHAPVPKPAAVNSPVSAQRTAQPASPETARASAGEVAAANIRTETARSVDAPEQTAVAPRLRDQETAERTRRSDDTERPTGPPPAFEETPLQRQARVALEPPEVPERQGTAARPDADQAEVGQTGVAVTKASKDPVEPPPTRTERAEASFAETRSISDDSRRTLLDVKN